MSYPELAVLAAIYSKIGASRRPVRILREEILKRAHGFKSDCVFRAEMNGRDPFVTPHQVRSIIERLQARKFFARVTYARRQKLKSLAKIVVTAAPRSERNLATDLQRYHVWRFLIWADEKTRRNAMGYGSAKV
jgi:hypothetical protein